MAFYYYLNISNLVYRILARWTTRRFPNSMVDKLQIILRKSKEKKKNHLDLATDAEKDATKPLQNKSNNTSFSFHKEYGNAT